MWLDRFEAKVAAGERHPRTLEAHRYQLEHNLLPALGEREVAAITVDDIATLLSDLQRRPRSAKTTAGALSTLHAVLHFATPARMGDRRSRRSTGTRRAPASGTPALRVLGRAEIERLLDASSPPYRLMIATALYTGLRISELLGLTWSDIDFGAGVISVRAQLSRAHRGAPARRVVPKSTAAYREIPLIGQLGQLLLAHKRGTSFAGPTDWVLRPRAARPSPSANVSRRGLRRAVVVARLDRDGWPVLRFYDLRHTISSSITT